MQLIQCPVTALHRVSLKLMCFSPLSHPCVHRIVISTCRPSPFRCRLSCSWTAPWPTRTITCTRTWRRTRHTWCFPRRRSGCRSPRSRRNPRQQLQWSRRQRPRKPPTKTRASRIWDWRRKNTPRRWDCDVTNKASRAMVACWSEQQKNTLFMVSCEGHARGKKDRLFIRTQTVKWTTLCGSFHGWKDANNSNFYWTFAEEAESEYNDIKQLGRLFGCLCDKANISALILRY